MDTAWTLELDACLLRPDHKAAVVAFTLPSCSASPPEAKSRDIVDPLKYQDWWHAVRALPPQPWSLSVDRHDAALCHDLLHTAKRFRAPCSIRTVRPYVSAQSLQYLKIRKLLRSDLAAATSAQSRLLLRSILDSWKRRGDTVPNRTQDSTALDKHIAVLLRMHRLFADCVRSQIRASKRAYIEELGAAFASATAAKDIKALYAALRCLVPSASKRRSTASGAAVVRADGRPFPDHASRAAGWASYFADIEGGHPVSWESLVCEQVDRIFEGRAAPPPALN